MNLADLFHLDATGKASVHVVHAVDDAKGLGGVKVATHDVAAELILVSALDHPKTPGQLSFDLEPDEAGLFLDDPECVGIGNADRRMADGVNVLMVEAGINLMAATDDNHELHPQQPR